MIIILVSFSNDRGESMTSAIRSAVNEFIERLRQSGLDVALKETYMGNGFTIIARSRRVLTHHVFEPSLIEALRRVCRDARQRAVTDRLGNPRVQLSDVRARCGDTNAKAFGMLVRSCGLSIVNSGGTIWIACDAAWDRFVGASAVKRTPV